MKRNKNAKGFRSRQWVALLLAIAMLVPMLPAAPAFAEETYLSDGSLNYPLLAAATGSISRNPVGPIANIGNLTDGSDITHIGDLYWEQSERSFSLDFGAGNGVKLTEVHLQARRNSETQSFPGRINGARVLGSEDALQWTEITTSRAVSTMDKQVLPVGEGYKTTPYRYLKITADGHNNIFNLSELRLFGELEAIPDLIQSVSISSSNADQAMAIAGDTVTLTFQAMTPLQNVNAIISGTTAQATSSDNLSWTVSHTVSPYAFAQPVSFAITYTDEAGNVGVPATATTDGSAVVVREPADYLDLLSDASRFGIPVKGTDGTLTVDYSTHATPSGLSLAQAMMDHNTGTHANWNGPDNTGFGPYLVIDMGEGRAVSPSRAYILPRADQVGRLAGTYLEGSHDGLTWHKISSSAAATGQWETLTMTERGTYRYLKVTNDNRWHLNVAELKLYGAKRQPGELFTDDLLYQLGRAQEIVQGGQGAYAEAAWNLLMQACLEGQAAIDELEGEHGAGITQEELDRLTAAVQEAISGLKQEVQIISVVSETGFIHPGVGFTKEVLENVRHQIDNQQEPWYSYYVALLETDQAKTSFTMSNSLDGVTVRQNSYNASNVKDMAFADGKRAFTQAFLYYVTGNEVYRSNAMRILRIWQQMDPNQYQYFADAHIHTGIPLYYMVMAAEILRYTTSSEEWQWTEEDTEKFTDNVIDPTVRTFLDFNDKFMNQHNYPLYGSIASYIFKNDKSNYDKAIEWFTVNDTAPDKTYTGSIYWLFREMTQNDETGEPVEPHVQLVEMGRDLAHSDGDVSNMIALSRMIEAQGTRVHPVDGTVTEDDQGVSVYAFLNHRILAGVDYFFQFQQGYDIQWTPAITAMETAADPARIYAIVSDEYKGRIMYTAETGWNLYYVYRYQLGYSDEELEAIAPYFMKGFKERVAPNFYFAGSGSDSDVTRRATGADWWLHIPEAVADEAEDSMVRFVREPVAHENRYKIQLEEGYSILDGSNAVVYDTDLIRTVTEGESSFIRAEASDNHTLFAAYKLFFINRNDTARVALKIRTNGRAELELKREREMAPFQTLDLPDTKGEWQYISFDMGQSQVSYGEFSNRTFLAYFNLVGDGTQVDIDYMDIRADQFLTPPTFNNITEDRMNLSLFAGSTVEYDFSATDSSSADTITYELQGDSLPGAVLDPSMGRLNWTVEAAHAGSYEALVVAGDGTAVTTVRLTIQVSGSRGEAIADVISGYDEDTDYESTSLEYFEQVYEELGAIADDSSDEVFYAALDRLARAVHGLRLLNPRLGDDSLNFVAANVTTSLRTGYDDYLIDNNTVSFSGDLTNKYFTMDFGPNFRVSPSAFAMQPRNNWQDRMSGAIVYGSHDGESWVQLTGEAAYSSQMQTLEVREAYMGEAYRYFKVSTLDTTDRYGRANNILSVGEFRIFGDRSEIPSRLERVSIGTDAAPLTQHLSNSANTQVPVKKAVAGDAITLDIGTKQPLSSIHVTIAGLDADVVQVDELNYKATVTLTEAAARGNASRNAAFEINYSYLDGKNGGAETEGLPMVDTTDLSTVLVSDVSRRIDHVLDKATLSFNRSTDLGSVIGPNLFDKNPNTFIDIRNNASAGNGVFYRFDFGDGGVSLSSVEVVPRMTTNLADRMMGAYVEGSNDGVNFNVISPRTRLVWDWQGLLIDDPTYYRYIRIINPSSWFGNLSELEMFGDYVADRSTIIAADKAALQLGYATGDRADSVTGNLELPGEGEQGSRIAWSSSQPSAVSNSGKVTRGAQDQQVTLTATLSSGTITDTKLFVLTVKGTGGSTGSNNGNGTGSVPTPPDKEQQPDLVTEVTIDEEGKASVIIGEADYEKALSDARSNRLVIEVAGAETAAVVALYLKAYQIRAAVEAKVAFIHIRTKQGSLDLPIALLDADGADAVIEVSKTNRAAIDLRIFVGNETIRNTAEYGPIRVSYPYSLQDGEHARQIVVYQLADNGQRYLIKNSRYDAGTGLITFDTRQLGSFLALHVDVSFTDLNAAPWAADAIAALAARGVVQGVTEQSFDPAKAVTRAEFVQLLVRLLDLEEQAASTGTFNAFNDIQDGAWYAEAIGIASSLGIVKGREDGSFGIHDSISRQDLAVMTYRALQAAGRHLDTNQGTAAFGDADAIADYARQAVSAMQQAGIVNGLPGGEFAPRATATRAQAAVILELLLHL
ncbi:S-layer homology domain-containing protein [Paenibacillus daejeonensis]|uniref:S-layer homology domain-containing protein n=1 Tax=Paenibacillus daejeonensis TaxID=135193 RepID=UPI0003611D93|nr:S-layer homology domain-containing protein [Paenibacillus daejeonensis]